jgi:hypothetical protein
LRGDERIEFAILPPGFAISVSELFRVLRLGSYLTLVKYPAANARPPGFVRKRSGGDYHATMYAAPAGYYARLG